MCYDEVGWCAHNSKENLHDLLYLSQPCPNYETWHENPCESQMLIEWDNLETDPLTRNDSGVENAHNRATYLKEWVTLHARHEPVTSSMLEYWGCLHHVDSSDTKAFIQPCNQLGKIYVEWQSGNRFPNRKKGRFDDEATTESSLYASRGGSFELNCNYLMSPRDTSLEELAVTPS